MGLEDLACFGCGVGLHEFVANIRCARKRIEIDFEIVFEWFEGLRGALVGYIKLVEMIVKKSKELFPGALMFGKAKGIFEYAATDHKTIHFGELLAKGECVSSVLNVAVDDELSIARDGIAQGDDLGNEFVVGGHFGHFFAGA